MYNTNAGEHRCHAHLHCRDDQDEDLLLLPGCSAELPLPLVARTANLLDATGQGIVGINGQDWNATTVELLAAITSSPSSTATIFRDDTRLLLHLALFRRRPVPPPPPLSSLQLGSTVHLTSLNMTSPPLPAAVAPSFFFRSSSFIGGRLCSLRLLVNSFRLHWAPLCCTLTQTQSHKYRHLHKTKSWRRRWFKIASQEEIGHVDDDDDESPEATD